MVETKLETNCISDRSTHCWHWIKEYSVYGEEYGSNRVYLCCFCGIEKTVFIPTMPQYFSILEEKHGPYFQTRVIN